MSDWVSDWGSLFVGWSKQVQHTSGCATHILKKTLIIFYWLHWLYWHSFFKLSLCCIQYIILYCITFYDIVIQYNIFIFSNTRPLKNIDYFLLIILIMLALFFRAFILLYVHYMYIVFCYLYIILYYIVLDYIILHSDTV